MFRFSRYLIFFIIAMFTLTKIDIVNADTDFGMSRSGKKEVVTILVDTSESMKINNLNGVIENNLGKFIVSLTSNYEVNLITYNENIRINESMYDKFERRDTIRKFNNTEYKGYSNIGRALKRAIDYIERSENFVKKDIIIISDNDIFMENEFETERTRSLFKDQISRARDLDINIHSIEFGNMYPEENILLQASQETDGLYFNTEEMNIEEIFDSLLTNKFPVKKYMSETFEYNGGILPITINVPFKYHSYIKIIITSDKHIEEVKTSFDVSNNEEIYGEGYYALLTYEKQDEYKLEFQGEPGAIVKVDVIIDYYADGLMYVKNKFRKVDGKLSWEKVTLNRVVFRDGDYFNVFKHDNYFESFPIYLKINDETVELRLKEGQLYWETPFIKNKEEQEIILDFSAFPVNVLYNLEKGTEFFIGTLMDSFGTVDPIVNKTFIEYSKLWLDSDYEYISEEQIRNAKVEINYKGIINAIIVIIIIALIIRYISRVIKWMVK